jgi:hypothetical protein
MTTGETHSTQNLRVPYRDPKCLRRPGGIAITEVFRRESLGCPRGAARSLERAVPGASDRARRGEARRESDRADLPSDMPCSCAGVQVSLRPLLHSGEASAITLSSRLARAGDKQTARKGKRGGQRVQVTEA